jgi:predicted transglutaminase-like cysteine proteinase
MDMRPRFLGFAALIVAASVAVISAQHRQDTHSAGTHGTRSHQVLHDMCESHHAAGASSHHAEMSAALGLSAEQLSTIERINSEACAAMAKYHEQILAVLTPEQRAKMQEHHGATDQAGKAHSGTRRHGGT